MYGKFSKKKRGAASLFQGSAAPLFTGVVLCGSGFFYLLFRNSTALSSSGN